MQSTMPSTNNNPPQHIIINNSAAGHSTLALSQPSNTHQPPSSTATIAGTTGLGTAGSGRAGNSGTLLRTEPVSTTLSDTSPQQLPLVYTISPKESAFDYDSDDSQLKKRVKIASVEYFGKSYAVTGKENVISILRETQSIRTLMGKIQVALLTQYDGDYVNNYNYISWRNSIM